MNETISRTSTVFLALFAFIFGIGGFAGFHYVSDASADSSQEETQENTDGDSGNTVILEREAPQPQQTQAPTIQQPISTSDYLVPEVATRQYTRAELETLDNYQLYLARNEIFARHGMIFSDKYPDLRDYFARKSWYQPIYTRDEWIALEENGYKQLNATEDYNAELMLSIEKSRNSPYTH